MTLSLGWILTSCTLPVQRPDPAARGGVVTDSGTLPPAVSRCPADDPSCVDLATLPPTWTTDEPAYFDVISGADFDGDGVQDLLVVTFDPTTQRTRSSIRFGGAEPWTTPRSFPNDEDLGFDGLGVARDLDHDGQMDLVVEGTVYPGPFVAGRAPVAIGTLPPLGRAHYDGDYDLDGFTDLVVFEPWFNVSIWTGPWTTWLVDPPTLHLTIPCEGELYFDWGTAQLTTTPDLDQDGLGELWVAGMWPGTNPNCRTYRLPVGLTGEIDVPSSFAPAELDPPLPVGDQDGDGRVDWWIPTWPTTGSQIVSGPVTEVDGAWTGREIGKFGGKYQPFGWSVMGDDAEDFVLIPEAGWAEVTGFVAGGENGEWRAGTAEWTVFDSRYGVKGVLDGAVVFVSDDAWNHAFVQTHSQ